MSISTTRVLPTSDTKNSFKAKLREYKPYFSSPILAGRMEEIEPMLVTQSSVTGINSHSPVSVRLFDYDEVVGIGTTSGDLSNAENRLIYFPGLEGDRVIVRVGAETATIDFVYTNAVTVNGSDLTLDNSFTIGGQEFYVRGAGGALIQTGGVAPTYSVTPSATSVNEGSTINFVVNTQNVGVGTTLYYGTLVGAAGSTAASNDFTDSLTGSFNIVSDGTATGGIATITRSIASDLNIEGPETFRLVIRTDSITGSAVTTTADITINDLAPSATVGISTTSVNEGQSIEFTVNTTNVSAGSTLFFSSGGTAVAADFTDNSLTGSFVVSATGITTFTRTLVAEGATEGSENFNLVIRTNSTTGTALTTTPSITINDVFPSYNFVLTNQSGIVTDIADEGEVVTVTLNTTNIATGTEFRVWFDEEPGTNSDKNYRDFGYYNAQQNAFNSGNAEVITITGAATTFGIGARYDFRENENDTFRIILRERTASSSGAALTFATLQVNDVHLLYDVTTDKTVVNEGDDLTVTFGQPRHPVTGIGVPMPDGPVYVTLEPVSGTFPIVNNAPGDFSSGWGDLKGKVQTGFRAGYGNSSTFTIPIYADFITEGLESFYVAFRGHEYTHPIIARTANITINDTSKEPGSNSNGLTFGPVIVNRDNGNPANATDWYKICKIDDLPEGSSIALFIDTSGSMTLQTVRASYDAFIAKLNAKNITVTTVTNNQEDWITPFLTNLP